MPEYVLYVKTQGRTPERIMSDLEDTLKVCTKEYEILGTHIGSVHFYCGVKSSIPVPYKQLHSIGAWRIRNDMLWEAWKRVNKKKFG